MKNRQWILIAALAAASTGVMAEEMSSTTRQERMDAAYQNYKSGGMRTDRSSTAPMSHSSSGHAMKKNEEGMGQRSENAVKRGYHKTSEAVKHGASAVGHGAEKVGHSVANGARSARDAVTRQGEKMGGSSDATIKQNN